MSAATKPTCWSCRDGAHAACTKWPCYCEVCFPKPPVVPPLAQSIRELGDWDPTPAQATALLRDIADSAREQ